MTEPVIEISGVRVADRDTKRGAIFKRNKADMHSRAEEDDNVDISEEARSRSAGEKSGDDHENGSTAGG